MDKKTLETILDVLTVPLDIYNSGIQDAQDGIIKVDDTTLERLKSLERDYDQDLRKFRTQFLEAILVEGRPADGAMVNFWLAYSRLALKHTKYIGN